MAEAKRDGYGMGVPALETAEALHLICGLAVLRFPKGAPQREGRQDEKALTGCRILNQAPK